MADPMHFERYGRTYQLRIDKAEHLGQVLELDDSLWAAMSAPIASLNGDTEFLRLVDLDGNGRIRTDELRAAIRWLLDRLGDHSGITEQSEALPLDHLAADHPETEQLKQTAEYVLASLDAADRSRIDLEQVRRFHRAVDAGVINGDGVVPPEAAENPVVREFISDVMSYLPGAQDLSGRKGITEVHLDRFLNDARTYLDWATRGDIPDGRQTTDIKPLGEDTQDAWGALEAVRGKMEEFFARCRFMRFRPDAADSARLRGVGPGQAHFSSAEEIDSALAQMPLGEPNPADELDFNGPINPACAEALEEFRQRVVEPILGSVDKVTERQWASLKGKFQAFQQWRNSKTAGELEPLGRQKLREYVGGPCAAEVRRLLGEDREVADRLKATSKLQKLLLYQSRLLTLARNFVSFPSLYSPRERALFEMGSLVIDGRWFNFAVRVDDVGKHKEVARTSRMFVFYCKLYGPAAEPEMTVAVPGTAGTVGNLCIGKCGVFYDTAGREYDAQVVDIIENPISFREAVAAPFVRLGQFIGGKIEAISGAAQKELEQQAGKVTESVQSGVQQTIREAPVIVQQPAPAPASQAAGNRRDMILGASVSVAALGSAFAFITNQLTKALENYWLLLGALGLILAVILIPTIVVAALKLRRRDLSAILEGCGWAINARMRLNRPQRRQFTRCEPYPAAATGTPRSRWLLWMLLVILLPLVAAASWMLWRRLQPEKAAHTQQQQEQPEAGTGQAPAVGQAESGGATR